MRKRFTCFLVSLTVCLCTSMTAYAENDMEQENPSSVNVSNSIGFVDPSSDDSATGDAGDYNGPLNRIGAYPYMYRISVQLNSGGSHKEKVNIH